MRLTGQCVDLLRPSGCDPLKQSFAEQGRRRRCLEVNRSQRGDLQQVITRLMRGLVAQRERACQRQEPLDQRFRGLVISAATKNMRSGALAPLRIVHLCNDQSTRVMVPV